MQLGSFANAGQVIDEVRHGFEHDQADPFWVHWPAWRKFGLGAMFPAGLRWAASFAAAAATAALMAGFGATCLAGVVRFGGVTVRVSVRVATVCALGALWRTGVVAVVAVVAKGLEVTAWAVATGVVTGTAVVVVDRTVVDVDGGVVVVGGVVVGAGYEIVTVATDAERRAWT